MERERINELFRLCGSHYSEGGRNGFESFVENYKGSEEEKDYLLRVRAVLEVRGSDAKTRVWGFACYKTLNDMIEETFYLSKNGVREKLEEYLD